MKKNIYLADKEDIFSMIPMEIKCRKCKYTFEVNSYRKFTVCPNCQRKEDFPGFTYKEIGQKDSIVAANIKYEQDCPCGRGKHMLFSSMLGQRKCIDCGYTISGIHQYFGIFWFCDSCDTFMNIQDGFTTKNKKWICTECGFENSVSRKDVF